MPWNIQDSKLHVTGEQHYDSNRIKWLIKELKKQEPHRSKKICRVLEKFLHEKYLCEEDIWLLTKWCDWSHKKAEETAQKLFSELFYDIKLDRLLDQEDKPKPSENEANKKYIGWLNKLESKQRELASECEEDKYVSFDTQVQKFLKGDSLPEPVGKSNPEHYTVETRQYKRDPKVAAWILKNAKGHCECCKQPAPFLRADDTAFLEVHHLRRLADGGSDTIKNSIAVCPNCHRALHYSKEKAQILSSIYEINERLLKE